MNTKGLVFVFYMYSAFFATVNIAFAGSLKDKKILILSTAPTLEWGSCVYRINLYKNLIKYGINATMLVKNSVGTKELKKLNLPYYSFNARNESKDLFDHTYKICKDNNIDIIHCHNTTEALVAKQVAKILPIRIVVTLHVENIHNQAYLKDFDGVLAVSPGMAELVKKENERQQFGIKAIDWTAPFFDEAKFLNFKTKDDREKFFNKNFSLHIYRIPVICMIGNFYPTKAWKNHPLLFEAVQKLIYKKHTPVCVVLAGDGPRKIEMQQLAKQLKIDKFVHFLDYVTDIPALLYHSDIAILTSKEEGFGIVLLEAAYMKKPLVGAMNTGMTAIVKDGLTGALFENGNVDDLVKKLEVLIKEPGLRYKLGVNAKKYAQHHFSIKATMEKLILFYQKVLDSKKSGE